MRREVNPLLETGRNSQDQSRYLLAAAEFWMEAVQLQEKRCQARHEDSRDFVADIIFYLVAIQHLREIASRAEKNLGSAEAKGALDTFDQRWPKFRHLRNLLEHVLTPRSDPKAGHFGVSFLPGSIVDLRPGGEVEYLIDVREAGPSIRLLYETLTRALQIGTNAP